MTNTLKSNNYCLSIPRIFAIDLFCGVGGLTHGLQRAGINVCLGVDIDPLCKYPYEANNRSKFLLKSVEDLDAYALNVSFRKKGFKLLAGCAPCQTFSSYNQKAKESDRRWWLLSHFSRLVGEMLPELVTMENVPRLEDQNVFLDFVKNLRELGYFVWYEVVNCASYGVPQHRNRLVLLASKIGTVKLFSPTEFGADKCTVEKAIGYLPHLVAGMHDSTDPLHQASALSEINLRRIQASQAGKTWREWPQELIAECHKKKSGKSYASVYGRMIWGEPSPTITTQFYGFGNGRFGHPEQDRAISLREGAILQGFPREYKFIKPGAAVRQKSIGRLIGNAVPVTLGEVIGVSLLSHVGDVIAKN